MGVGADKFLLVLAFAVILGALAGAGRAWLKGRKLIVPDLAYLWLVPIAFAPQFFAFFFTPTREQVPGQLVPFILVGSQILLLLFAAINLHLRGFWLMLLGVAANMLVVALNGGWMPISPETVRALAPKAPAGSWQIGERLGYTKDLVLAVEDTRFWFLSDRFLFPRGFPFQAAFSLGDLLLAAGVVWFMWSLGGTPGNIIQE